jgi:LVIVD repeat
MRRLARLLVVGALVALVVPSVAQAGHTTDPRTKNMIPLGHIIEPAVLGGFGGGNPDINTDIAFRGDLAFQGNWDGFSIRDISDPDNPTTVSRTFCDGNQGDIAVYRNILVRSWNTGAGAPGPFGAGTTCDGVSFPAQVDNPPGAPVEVPGWEGIHVFDISNLQNPELVGSFELSARPGADMPGCGSHTVTLAPDLEDNRVLLYNATSGGNAALPPGLQDCDWVDILQVPLSNPSGISHVNRVPLEGGHAAHDNGVILGDVNKLAVASGHMSNVFSIGGPNGGTKEDPKPLFTIEEEGVCNTGGPLCNGNWHSAAFTWDGDTIVLGWEPGGGLQAECEATDPDVKKSFFFYDADTGAKTGQWTLPRAQGANENCTLHNYNLIPLKSGQDIMVSGNYQAGEWVIDITNPHNPKTVAWSDPPPAPPVDLGTPPGGTPIFCSTVPQGCPLTGAWSGYWYNGFIYESQIGEGLNIFELGSMRGGKRISLSHLNPQTQEFSLKH